jgi:hypothetical protein
MKKMPENLQLSCKKPYQEPCLRVYGDIRVITMTKVAGGSADTSRVNHT